LARRTSHARRVGSGEEYEAVGGRERKEEERRRAAAAAAAAAKATRASSELT
jgi:hypothetical protein